MSTTDDNEGLSISTDETEAWARKLAGDMASLGDIETQALADWARELDANCVTSLNAYQHFAGVTANEKLSFQTNLAVLALGVAGEAGEVADHIKKHLGHDHELDRDKVIKELGDVLWYVATLSNALGVTLQQVAQRNIDKLKARYPDGFSVQRSKERTE